MKELSPLILRRRKVERRRNGPQEIARQPHRRYRPSDKTARQHDQQFRRRQRKPAREQPAKRVQPQGQQEVEQQSTHRKMTQRHPRRMDNVLHVIHHEVYPDRQHTGQENAAQRHPLLIEPTLNVGGYRYR